MENNKVGIFLFRSDHNLVTSNLLIGNDKCIEDMDGWDNIYENNRDCEVEYTSSSDIILLYGYITWVFLFISAVFFIISGIIFLRRSNLFTSVKRFI